jgi:hypothetical protein
LTGNVTGNVSGSSGSCTGNAATATTASACSGNSATATTASNLTGLTLNSSAAPINPDSVTQNQLGYNNSVSLFGQTDGGLYSSTYSSSWIHQIFGDFRTGQIAIRGKNNGTWQAWRTVLDSSNYSSYALPLSGGTISGSVVPNANNTINLGSSGARWANVFSNDLDLCNEGGSNSVDGTWGSYLIQEGYEDLFMINRRTGKKYKFLVQEVQ